MDDSLHTWEARVIIKSQNAHAPCLNSATFKFDLGPFASEDCARECWKSLGFLLPENARVLFEMVEGSCGEPGRGEINPSSVGRASYSQGR
jgi:hypothetical protein